MIQTADIEKHLPLYLDFLRRLVAENSFTINKAGISRNALIIREQFASLGFQAEQVPAEDPQYGEHLFLRREGTSAKTIALISHLDTVFSEQEEKNNNFSWQEGKERIYGPGVIDIKGGTMMIYAVLSLLQEHAPELFKSVSWLIAINAAEERGVPDFAKRVLERLNGNGQAALVFEPGKLKAKNFHLVQARKGRGEFRIEVSGRGAHVGNSFEMGASALRQLARLVEQVESFSDPTRQLSCNVGIIQAGDTVNRVPHFAFAEGEFRCFDEAAFEEIQKRLLSLTEKPSVFSLADNFPCQISVHILGVTGPWPVNPDTENLLAIWQSAAEEQGQNICKEARGGLSDGNFLVSHLPTLDGLGLSGENMHCSERSADGSKDQEYADKEAIVPKILLNVSGLTKLLKELNGTNK